MSTEFAIEPIIIYLIIAIIFILLLIIFFIVFAINKSKKAKKETGNISEWSYKRYADFYGMMELADPKFEEKINKILKLILDEHCDDIKFISNETGCTIEECIIKINYLKNKRKIDNCYIDKDNLKIINCSENDIKLIEKYKAYIYGSHSSLEEIVSLVPSNQINIDEKRATVVGELKYLIDNNILNGVKYNEVDNKLIYYSVEKHNKEKDLATISCPKCGALNDVDYNNKVRCKYCNNIISNDKTLEELKNSIE